MTTPINTISVILALNTFLTLAASWPRNPSPHLNPSTFYQCITHYPNPEKITISDFYDPNTNQSSFKSVLDSTAQNLRCLGPSVAKPLLIFVPSNESHVQAAVSCAQYLNLNVRIRSGGHDYEGISYISLTGQSFIIIDLSKFRQVDVDVRSRSAWVQAGATVGELYYWISQKSRTLGFPAGLCTSLGIGGHLTGGAYGPMMRTYGLGADNVLDARILVADGRILDRESMGDDLFWAIRGGGGGSFGIILSWRVKLVPVPSTVTVFRVPKTLEQNGTDILQKWQAVAPIIDWKLFMRVIMLVVPATPASDRTVQTLYEALYLGNKTRPVKLLKKYFPELGLKAEDCKEMSWIESVVYIGGSQSTTKPVDLLRAKPAFLNYFKEKSDFVTTAVTKEGIEGMLEKFMEDPGLLMIWNPYGGKMSKISEDAIPFAHRNNVLYKIQYVVNWNDDKPESQKNHTDSIGKLYDYMTSHVSKLPRQAYVNYRDLDVGKDQTHGSQLSCPHIWGPKYFKNNFWKLVHVKTRFDPYNFFRHEQSIPTWSSFQCVKLM